MRAVLLAVTALWSSAALALPGVQPGDDCAALRASIEARGRSIEERQEADSVSIFELDDLGSTVSSYVCRDEKVESQIFVLRLDSEKQAREKMRQLRDEIAGAIGKAEYDGTDPDDLRIWDSVLAGSDESFEIQKDFISWGDWLLLLTPRNSDRSSWSLTISFDPPARRVTSP